jgi:hypothetical protein
LVFVILFYFFMGGSVQSPPFNYTFANYDELYYERNLVCGRAWVIPFKVTITCDSCSHFP